MDEENKSGLTPEEPENAPPPYTPASRGKRIVAWIGVIVMVALVIAYSYSIATGSFLWW